MKKISVFAILALAGCSANSQATYLPDGSSGYRISCSGEMGDMGDCVLKAGDICGPSGYQAYDQNGHIKSDAAENQTAIASLSTTTDKYSKSPDSPRYLFIKCKDKP